MQIIQAITQKQGKNPLKFLFFIINFCSVSNSELSTVLDTKTASLHLLSCTGLANLEVNQVREKLYPLTNIQRHTNKQSS